MPIKKPKTCYIYKRNFTDIHKYNSFLLELDSKLNKELNEEAHKEIIDLTCKPNLQNLLNDIDKTYKKGEYFTKQFTGITPWEALLSIVGQEMNPNLYRPILPNPNPNPNPNPLYNHDKSIKTMEQIEANLQKEMKKVEINEEIKTVSDLLSLIDRYPDDKNVEYNINIPALHKIREPLKELDGMIGMKELKENIVDQIIFYIQNLQTGNDFLHTVIYGPPGTGKTEIAKILGSIFSKMGILNKGTFKKVTRADLIAGYLGQTAIKTKDVIKESLGGVLFIDEAYALGNKEKLDSFSKECIDTLCEALSDNKENLMVIVAGYEKELHKCFFKYNQGLKSRFTWRFKTDDYSAEDLSKIFFKKVNEAAWKIGEPKDINVKWFEKHLKQFKAYGRDIETLFAKIKIAHSRRVFCLDSDLKRSITLEDMNKGLELYLKNQDNAEKAKALKKEKKKEEKDRFKSIVSSMYV
jgi:AAA+ superfamily predicted ATPase